MTKDPRVYLAHILECVERVERFTADGRERFLRDAMVQDAVLRNFEVIGEAAKRLRDDYRTAHRRSPGALWPACVTCSSTNTKALTLQGCGPS
jgi:uncharacterized protein with HEPN domain